MDFKIGDKIVWFNSVTNCEVREGTITKMARPGEIDHLIWVDKDHKPEDCIFAGYCLPFAAKEELVEVLATRARLTKAYDDSMGLIYRLRAKF
jgi:hypothetical protein